jgi:hypothetical protein
MRPALFAGLIAIYLGNQTTRETDAQLRQGGEKTAAAYLEQVKLIQWGLLVMQQKKQEARTPYRLPSALNVSVANQVALSYTKERGNTIADVASLQGDLRLTYAHFRNGRKLTGGDVRRIDRLFSVVDTVLADLKKAVHT